MIAWVLGRRGECEAAEGKCNSEGRGNSRSPSGMTTRNATAMNYCRESTRHFLRAFDCEGGGLRVASFAGLGSSYCDLVAAGGDGANSFVIDLRESAWIEGEGDVFGLAGSEADAVM